MIRYSFVVPIYRDARLGDAFCAEFQRVFREYLGTTAIEDAVELIFVNDDGSEETAQALRQLCDVYSFAKAITLSRNFGQHTALSCGYAHAQGQYVGMLNVDMEDPPDQIPLLLREIEKAECDIVWGLRRKRHGPRLAHFTSLGFGYLLNKATGYDIPLNVATLRVMNRPFIDAYNQLTEKGRYIPGLEMWLGFRRGYVDIVHRGRSTGRSSYTFAKRLNMAFEAMISFSDLPLRFLVLLGSLIALIGVALAVFLVVGKIFFTDYQAGYTSTISTIVFLGGVQIMVVAVASLYIGRILKEVQNRPLYIIRAAYKVDPVYPTGARPSLPPPAQPDGDGAHHTDGRNAPNDLPNTRNPEA